MIHKLFFFERSLNYLHAKQLHLNHVSIESLERVKNILINLIPQGRDKERQEKNSVTTLRASRLCMKIKFVYIIALRYSITPKNFIVCLH